MAAIELSYVSEIQIFKDASTKNLEIKGFNHFSTGDLSNKVTDNTLKLFMLIVGSLMIAAVVIFVVMKILQRFNKKNEKHTTFDAIDGAIFNEDLKNSFSENAEDRTHRNLSESMVSDLSEYKFGQENPNDISDIFTSLNGKNGVGGSPAQANRHQGANRRMKSAQKFHEDEEEDENEKLA